MNTRYVGSRILPLLVTINGFIVVALGAFGAHRLKVLVGPEALQIWQTGVRYQMFHVAALLACAFFAATRDPDSKAVRWAIFAAGFFVLGILFFSGSLYLLVLIQQSWLGLMAAVGGVCFLLGWTSLTVCVVSRS